MGKGGMRWGAGRPAYRAKAEQLQRVDVRQWHRLGNLRQGRSFSWGWHRGDEKTGSIGVLVHGTDSLRLQYSIGEGGERRDGSQTIYLEHTECHFGNTRPWFLCPVCRSRVGLLFMRWGRFACRRCQRVAYSSQSEDALDRTWRRQGKLELRLGAHWKRPKGMRRATYERLTALIFDCEERRDEALSGYVAKLGLRL